MEKFGNSLFLLEVLVDKVNFKKSPCFADKEFKTGITITCLGMPPMEIWNDDSGPQNDGPFIATFNSGKSCLFPLKECAMAAAKSKFTVHVSVFKALPCSCLPTDIPLGEATIDMTKEFVQSLQKYTADPNSASFEALKDSFVLTEQGGGEVGQITMFLRISCFGSQIVTRFQGDAGGPPNVGGGMRVQPTRTKTRSCNEPRLLQSPKEPCSCSFGAGGAGGSRGSGAPCPVHGASGAVCPPARDPYNSQPCQDPDDPCYCTGPKPPAQQQMACRNTDQYCLHLPKGRSKQFEEIGTNLGGNELKIKVPASASIIKKISQTHCAMQCPYVKGGKDGGPCVPPCGKNQISLALPSEATCCRGAQLADTQFTCTTEGCTQVSKHGQQAAMLRGTGDRQELPNKDVFVLKVAKTALQGDRKCKLELELVTPKGADKDLPVQKVNTRIQSDLDCECCVRRIRKSKKVK